MWGTCLLGRRGRRGEVGAVEGGRDLALEDVAEERAEQRVGHALLEGRARRKTKLGGLSLESHGLAVG